MTLIPNTNPNITAYYNEEGYRFRLPVLAYSEDGDPLAMCKYTGRLVRAETLYGYEGIEDGRYQLASFTPAYNPEVCLELYSDRSENTKRVQIPGWFSSRRGQVPAVADPQAGDTPLVPLEPEKVQKLFPGYTKARIAYGMINH